MKPANVRFTGTVRKPIVLDPEKVRERRVLIAETCAGIEGESLVTLLTDRLARAELAIAELRR